MYLKLILVLLLSCNAFFAESFLAADTLKQQSNLIQPDNFFPQVKIETNIGNIIVELDRLRAPITTNNFLSYVVTGAYDGTIFHRVVKDFVVQGGGYDILYNERTQQKAIFNESGNGLKNQKYTIAMARVDDPHSATNQFYFNMADNKSLDPGKTWGYTVFGLVMQGSEVLDLISNSQVHFNKELGWDEVPINPIIIKKIILIKQE